MSIHYLQQSVIFKKNYKCIVAFIILATFGQNAFSKSYELFKTEIYSDKQIKVEVEFKLYDTICLDPQKSNKFVYIISGQLYTYSKDISWQLKYTDCNGVIQVENKQVFIGGPNAVKGSIESLDQRFVGFLYNYSNSFYIETIISNIDDLIKNNNFLKAKEELENKSFIIKDSTLINKEYSLIYTRAQTCYVDSLNSLLNKDKVDLASKLIIEAENLYKILPANILSKKKEIELIKLEQKRIVFENQINELIKQNNILQALIIYNANVGTYRSKILENVLIEKATSSTNNSLNSNDYENAKIFFNELYKLTRNEKYLLDIQKCDKELQLQEIRSAKKLHKELLDKVKQNKSIYNLEKLYNIESKYDIFSTKNTAKKLNNIWITEIETYSKYARKDYKIKDYRNALDNFNKSIDKINDYNSKLYSINYNSSIAKIKSKIDDKKVKVNDIVNSFSSSKLDLLKNNYEKKKLKYKVLKIGVSYDFVNEGVNSLSTYFSTPSNLTDDISDIYYDFSISRISTFLTYNRLGLFAGNYYTSSNIKNYNVGLQYRLFGSFYGKVGYNIKSDEKITMNNFALNYITGISLIVNGLNIETTYNHRYKTVQLGMGINIYKRFNKKRYKYLQEITK